MYSINTFTKKKYITPVIEFEMMEEGGALMKEHVSTTEDGTGGNGEQDPFGAKQSDFIFDDDWSSEQSDISNENNGAW